jgi:hypothetical protein
MEKEPIYTEAGNVSAEDGVVHLDGPDAIHVQLTPEAAEEISDRLMTGALKARGQRFFLGKKSGA